jgi:hypothetical protein
MKLFKYIQFLNESNQDIDSICKEYNIKNYTINQDGSIDVDSDVYLSFKKLTELPLKFRNVSGDFHCDNNKLTSLEGAPKWVGGDFWCNTNKLNSLEGCPKSVVGIFWCDNNQLKDVYGIKEGFRLGEFYISGNPVEEIFKFFPKDRYHEVIELLNEYGVIRDGNRVILQALEEVFHEMDLDCPEIEYIKGYEVI